MVKTLRTCQYCGNKFYLEKKRENNARKYCSDVCSYYAYLERHNEAQKRYMKKLKELGLTEKGYMLGNSNIKQHRNPNFDKELKTIRNELKRLGI